MVQILWLLIQQDLATTTAEVEDPVQENAIEKEIVVVIAILIDIGTVNGDELSEVVRMKTKNLALFNPHFSLVF